MMALRHSATQSVNTCTRQTAWIMIMCTLIYSQNRQPNSCIFFTVSAIKKSQVFTCKMFAEYSRVLRNLTHHDHYETEKNFQAQKTCWYTTAAKHQWLSADSAATDK